MSASASATTVVGPITPVTPAIPAPGPASAARLVNLSTRARVSPDSPLITGFAIRGGGTRTLLVRAAGPSLLSFGINDPVASPRLHIFDANNQLVAENSGWASTPGNVSAVGAATASTGAFPFAANSGRDAAVVVTLPAGAYTVHVSDTSGRGGVTLAEIYDASAPSDDARLANVSTRSTIAAGGDLISGFVVNGTAPRQFLIRGVGPGLSPFGVANRLSAPVLSVYDASGRELVRNNDWSGPTISVGAAGSNGGTTTTLHVSAAALTTAAEKVGAFGLEAGSADAGVLVTLEPGIYTVQVSKALNSPGGTALLELYEMP